MDSFQLFVIALTALGSSLLWAKDRADFSALKPGEVEQVEIRYLHPTQFRVGQAEVDEKSAVFEKMGKKELLSYLKEHPCPVVIGPGGTPWIVDEQHRSNAALDAESAHHGAARALRDKRGKPTMFMKVVANYSGMTSEQFERTMISNHYVYLEDEGVTRPFTELPKGVRKMADDPYRSVAGFVENDAYRMEGVYFAQFSVATWLRENLRLADKEVSKELRKHRKKFLKKVTRLLRSKASEGQPWHLSQTPCAERFEGR